MFDRVTLKSVYNSGMSSYMQHKYNERDFLIKLTQRDDSWILVRLYNGFFYADDNSVKGWDADTIIYHRLGPLPE